MNELARDVKKTLRLHAGLSDYEDVARLVLYEYTCYAPAAEDEVDDSISDTFATLLHHHRLLHSAKCQNHMIEDISYSRSIRYLIKSPNPRL